MVVQGRDVRMDGRSPFLWKISKSAAVGWGEPFRYAFFVDYRRKTFNRKGRKENPESAQGKAVYLFATLAAFLCELCGESFPAGFSPTPFLPQAKTRYTGRPMANPIQPNVKLTNTPDYRETYANSVQIRVNVWDFFLVFGTLTQQSETQVEIQNFQGIYLSPQQAKALLGVLQQNVTGYENAFGEIKLDPRMMPHGPVH
jgi:flagellar protein FlaG